MSIGPLIYSDLIIGLLLNFAWIIVHIIFNAIFSVNLISNSFFYSLHIFLEPEYFYSTYAGFLLLLYLSLYYKEKGSKKSYFFQLSTYTVYLYI